MADVGGHEGVGGWYGSRRGVGRGLGRAGEGEGREREGRKGVLWARRRFVEVGRGIVGVV